jgi:hypothetical protein
MADDRRERGGNPGAYGLGPTVGVPSEPAMTTGPITDALKSEIPKLSAPIAAGVRDIIARKSNGRP